MRTGFVNSICPPWPIGATEGTWLRCTSLLIVSMIAKSQMNFYTWMTRRWTLEDIHVSSTNRVVNVVQSGSIACFERRLNKLWHGTVVMYDPDIDVRQMTKSKKDIRCCAHAQSDEDNHDMHISRGQPSTKLYELCSVILQSVPSAKYLGITIRSDLQWCEHVNNIAVRANSTLHFINRNLKYCPQSTRETAYCSLVRSTKSLENRRYHQRMTMMYNISHGLVAVPPTELVKPQRSTRGHHFKYQTIGTNNNRSKYSFYPRSIPEWNSLNSDIVTAPSVDSFKSRLSKLNR